MEPTEEDIKRPDTNSYHQHNAKEHFIASYEAEQEAVKNTVTIEFWIQKHRKSKKHYFNHITECNIKYTTDAVEAIEHYKSTSVTQALSTRHEVTQQSAIQKAMEQMGFSSIYNFGIVTFYPTK